MRIALIGAELEENLALRYIHASLSAAGHEAAIFDFHRRAQIEGVVQQVLAYAPELVGLSMVFTHRAEQFVGLARRLRECGFGGHITAGGHFASFNAEALLAAPSPLDTVLHGEGEAAMADLASRPHEPQAVLGASYRDAGGAIRHTPPRPMADDLDRRPWPTRPARFDDYLGMPVANMSAGRGCWGDCHFCSINAWHRRCGGKRFRQRSVQSVADEMAMLYALGVRIYNFHDDNFFLPSEADNLQRIAGLREALRQRGVGRIALQVKARPDSVRPGVMRELKALGLFRVFLGVESNAVSGLKALGRGITRRQNHAALRLLMAMDLHVTYNLLMFEPDCTLADLRDNVAFMARYARVPQNFCRVEVYSGTPLEASLRRRGMLLGDCFGYNYRLVDERCQLAFEVFRDVFTPRNFAMDGMNLAGMSVDYHLHVLKRFWPAQATRDLVGRCHRFIADLNASNVALLTRIIDFAETHSGDARSAAELTEALCAQRQTADDELRRRHDALLAEIARRSSIPRDVRRPAGAVAAAAAAAAMLATSCGCDPVPPAPGGPGAAYGDSAEVLLADGLTHPAEMAPAPAPPRTHYEELVPPPPGTHHTEPAPQPPRPPKTQPATSQASRPASGPGTTSLPQITPFAGKDLELLKNLVRKRYQGQVETIARSKDYSGEVTVQLYLDSRGVVQRYKLTLSPESRELSTLLSAKIIDWVLPNLPRAGSGEVKLTIAPPPPPDDPRTHIFEMAPQPRD
jgi:methylmalonyl-CoA mutase cobalamin-binding subunit